MLSVGSFQIKHSKSCDNVDWFMGLVVVLDGNYRVETFCRTLPKNKLTKFWLNLDENWHEKLQTFV